MTPLSTDLVLLVWSVALCAVQMLIAVMTAQRQVGLPALVGNRDDMPALTGLAGRARRAHVNMLESLVLFAALVLVAHAAGRANEMTALGAQLFFWSRLGYAAVYLAGLPWLRTGIWALSMAGLVLIFLQLL
ncbi:MAG: MAPEG family protein [Rhodospirillaceae bacterium]|nr:MAPEG family protein [Rhodospirillaceae bacterium]